MAKAMADRADERGSAAAGAIASAGAPARLVERIGALALPPAVWLIAAAMLATLLAVAAGYGFHRDEMYFILAGRHPDWGYVDQPPLTPLLSAASTALLGTSPLAVRIAPALAAATVVLLAADMARRFGGSRTAQVLGALVLAVSGWLGAGHLDVTVTFDILFWTIALWLLVQLLEPGAGSPDRRGRWLALGLVVGLALENKTLAVTLPATVAAAVLLLRRWDLARQPWPWLAGSIALVIWAPNLIWQAQHGWPQITMEQSIAAGQGPGLDGRLKALAELVAIAGPLLFPVSIAGIVWLLRAPDARAWRPLGVACLLQLGLMLAANGKSYYSAGFLPLVVAAGSSPLARWLSRGRVRVRRATFAGATAISGLAVAVLMLPIVPVASLHGTPIPSIYAESTAQVGWPQLAAQVEQVVASLPPDERARAVIVTADYGQYSALPLFGSGLPRVSSGHNSTWDWGRPPDGAAPVILVAFDPGYAASYFGGCRTVATIDNGFDLDTQEQGQPIQRCDGPLAPWHGLWPDLRHIN